MDCMLGGDLVYCLESLPKRRLPPDRAMFYVASTVLGLEDSQYY